MILVLFTLVVTLGGSVLFSLLFGPALLLRISLLLVLWHLFTALLHAVGAGRVLVGIAFFNDLCAVSSWLI
jgi:hypothetical protein